MRAACSCCLALVAARGMRLGRRSRATRGKDVKAAYYRRRDESAAARPLVEEFWVDDEYHSHANYVPREALETCPLTQRANATVASPSNSDHAEGGRAGRRVRRRPEARRRTSARRRITQGALVFGTSAIAGDGMKAVAGAMAKCPPTYEVRGGPSPILGTYGVSSRAARGRTAGRASSSRSRTPTRRTTSTTRTPRTSIVQRANVILYLDVTHQKIIGERSDSSAKAEAVLRTVLKRLG